MKHFYIHLPFCSKKCSYCDFISFEQHSKFIPEYHNALIKEIKDFSKINKSKEIKTIFIGGGTPSIYPLELLKDIFETLTNFNTENLEEVTIESNPEDITQKHLETWKELGVNRLSIGVQILDEEILKNQNRIQKNKSVIDLLSLAPKYFDNISVDLILGLPGTNSNIWFETLETITSSKIQHISIYFLTVYKKTPLYFNIKNKSILLPREKWLIKTYEKTIKFLKNRDFLQYEISNFSKPNFESIHNKAYWNRVPYRGFGVSASSFDGKKRFINSSNLIEFMNNCKPKHEEILNKNDIVLEEIMLGLRQMEGIDLQRMLYLLDGEKQEVIKGKISRLKQRGLIEEKNEKISLTTKGLPLSDEITLSLL